MRAGRAADRGSVAVELTLLAPLLLLLALFAVAAGRLADARLRIDDAAAQAARAAATAATPTGATLLARSTAAATLTGHAPSCQTSQVTVNTAGFHPGGAVTVHVSCAVSLAGLSLLHLPGTTTITGSFTAPIDLYRSGPASTP